MIVRGTADGQRRRFEMSVGIQPGEEQVRPARPGTVGMADDPHMTLGIGLGQDCAVVAFAAEPLDPFDFSG